MGKRIMVVDDSPVVQVQMQKLLEDTDYELVAFCRTGEEAIEQYDQIAPDAITMDIIMPGLDGIEAAQTILQQHPEARIVMVSSLAYDDTIQGSMDVGAKAFVFKPFQRDQLLSALEQALD